MEELKKLSKSELVSKLINTHDKVRNQASRYANSMGVAEEEMEKHAFQEAVSKFKAVEDEVLRRLP